MMAVLLFVLATLGGLWGLLLAWHGSPALLARWLGIAVEVVSIGVGPSLWVWRRGSMEWRFKLLPLGGSVRFPNLADDEEPANPDPLPLAFLGLALVLCWWARVLWLDLRWLWTTYLS